MLAPVTKKPLPTSCAACVFHPAPGGHCFRRAPAPGLDEFQLVFWPKVHPDDRCGDGAAVTDGDGPGLVACQTCAYWHQPGGQPVKPDYRNGLSVEWWAESGFCTKSAPVPSSKEDHRRTHWKVTHAAYRCGDGETLEILQPGA